MRILAEALATRRDKVPKSRKGTHDVQSFGQERSTAICSLARIGFVVCEELSLEIQCSTDSFVRFNIALATINDWNVTQSEGNTALKRFSKLLKAKSIK